MSSKHVRNGLEATSSKDRKVQPSCISTSTKIQRLKASGASHNTVASTTAPPPDPPPTRTANTHAEIFDKGHYDPAKVRPSHFFYAVDGLEDFISHPRIAVTVTIACGFLAFIFFLGEDLAFWMKNLNPKVCMLSSFTLALMGSLVFSTSARKQDAFAAKAVYEAILMVFLSGNFTTALETSTNTGLGASTSLNFTQTTLETSTLTALSTVIETVSAQTLQMTPTGSLVASQTSSIPLSTASASKVSGGLSQNQKIGLGVGLGVGIPVVLVGLLLYLNRRKLKRKAPLVIEPIHQGLY